MDSNKIIKMNYRKSFLKNIQSAFAFDSIQWSEDIKQKVKGILEHNGFEISETGVLPIVQSQKGTIALVVTDKGVILSTDVKDYHSFNDFTHYIDLVQEILLSLGCKDLKNFIFQKLNSYRLGKTADRTYTEENVYKALFSDELLKRPIAYMEEGDECIFTAQPTYKEEADYVVAQLQVSAICMGRHAVDSIRETLQSVNDKLNDVWFKTTSEGIHKIMENG